MASPFEAALSAADATMNATFGEEIEIRPRRPVPRGMPIADPNRPIRSVAGIVTITNGIGDIGGARLGSKLDGVTRLGLEGASVWMSAGVAAGLGYAVATGDLVVRTEKAGLPSFAVSAPPRPTEHGDVTLLLAPETIP